MCNAASSLDSQGVVPPRDSEDQIKDTTELTAKRTRTTAERKFDFFGCHHSQEPPTLDAPWGTHEHLFLSRRCTMMKTRGILCTR